jgi:hypothetical protein
MQLKFSSIHEKLVGGTTWHQIFIVLFNAQGTDRVSMIYKTKFYMSSAFW